MKTLITFIKAGGMAILLLLTLSGTVSSQTYSEWFRQKKTQKRYLLKQIAALRAYSDYLNKGYKVVKNGTNAISSITKGEFSLHKSYLFSLKSVNPALLKNGKLKAIIDFHKGMDQQRQRAWKRIAHSDLFSTAERIQVRSLFNALERDCNRTLQELEMVVTNGKVELSDDERIERIDAIYGTTQKLFKLHRSTVIAVNAVLDGRQWQLKQEKANEQLLNNR